MVLQPDMVKTFLDKLPTYLTDLDKLLKTNGGGDGYLVGNSVLDYGVYCACQ